MHAIAASGSVDGNVSPSSPEHQQWRLRQAPQRGRHRHAFTEKYWNSTHWESVGPSSNSLFIVFPDQIFIQSRMIRRFRPVHSVRPSRTASDTNVFRVPISTLAGPATGAIELHGHLYLFQLTSDSRVHELHPHHTFLIVPDRSASELQFQSPPPDPSNEQCKSYPTSSKQEADFRSPPPPRYFVYTVCSFQRCTLSGA